MSGYEVYRDIFGVDTEWGFREGLVDHESAFRPVVFCVVRFRGDARLAFWGCDPQLRQFLAENPDALFVAHNATAEMKYILRIGAPIPGNWYDTMVAERHHTNQPNPERVSLSASLHRRGLPHLAPQVKEELRQRILHLQFDPDDPRDRRDIEEYCLSDCDGCLALFRAQTEDV